MINISHSIEIPWRPLLPRSYLKILFRVLPRRDPEVVPVETVLIPLADDQGGLLELGDELVPGRRRGEELIALTHLARRSFSRIGLVMRSPSEG